MAFNYKLDPVGNRTVVTEAGVPTNYGYDALNELTSAQTWFLKTTWSYDPVGNRLSEASPFGVTNYTYDGSDRLLKAGTRTFAYDADGNQTSVTDAFTHLKRTYAFDAANRLVSVDGGLTSSFIYDGDGNRVSQFAGGRKQAYINDIAAALPVVLQDTYSAGSPSSYVYGLNLIEASQGRDNDFYQYDGLGSVIQLTDAFGRPEVSYLYDAWGNSILPAPPTDPFLFAGQARDSSTGLYFMRARYYDPSIGRFLARDPIRQSERVPLARNKYSYALSNPIRYSDPSGLGLLDWLEAGVDLQLGQEQGQQALSEYNSEITCAEETGAGCTLNDTVVNNTEQTQVQALQSIAQGGAAAGSAEYSGTNLLGSGTAAQSFDYTTLLLELNQTVQNALSLPGKLFQILVPTANAAGYPTQGQTNASGK